MTIGTAEKDALALGLAHIQTHPEDWDQNDWSCCLAHWTVVNHPEVRTVRAGLFGVEVVLRSGNYTTLGLWLQAHYPDMHGLWAAPRTLDELQAGVQAAINDRDVDEAIVNALLDRVARSQVRRAERALEGHMQDVLTTV